MTIAILCSGQGPQRRDMFSLTADAPEAADVFAAAAQTLGGRDPRAIVRDDDEATIHANALGQVLCSTQTLAAFVALKDTLGERLTIAGYSVGELASWGCAGLFSVPTLLALALQRAAFMSEADGPNGGLAFVRGLDRADVDGICARHDAAVAIVNPGAMFVVGGERNDLLALCEEALSAGAIRAAALPVLVASHTPRLARASANFRRALAAQRVEPRIASGLRLFSGIDGSAVLDVESGLDKLAAQISQTIDWEACLDACIEAGVDRFLELGPGGALASMASAAHPSAEARSLDDFRSLSGVKTWLGRA
jgi:[acyl-carrier-protein] S-malonyltransferase